MTESPWLTAEQQRIWRDYLQATSQLSSFLEAGLRPYGLSLAEYEVLVGLSEAPGRRLRMSELAAFAHQSRSRLTHTVARMERSGLVTRTACTADGRGVVAALTEEGLALIEQAARSHVAAVRTALVDAADEADFAAFGRVMTAVIDATRRGQRAPTES